MFRLIERDNFAVSKNKEQPLVSTKNNIHIRPKYKCMEYLSTCGLVRTTCHRSYMWHRRDAILIQEGVHGGNGLNFGPVQ